ncbi:MAG: response regulator FixJ [Methylocystis sp.]
MGDAATIHVVDDDPAVRDSLALLLKAEGQPCHTYFSARAFLDAIGQDATGCVVTDVRMPEMSGFELLSAMKERHISMPVIVITAQGDVPMAVAAMKQGAVDFIKKPFDGAVLLASVRAALKRGEGERGSDAEIQAMRERFATLTNRENEVLEGLLKGLPNKIIAYELGISVRTLEAHRAKLMAKTQARGLADLVRMALAIQQDPPGLGSQVYDPGI